MVAVAGAEAENETVTITFRLQRCGGAFASHDPVVMGFLGIFWAEIVFGDVSKDAQRLLRTILNQFHARMIFPGAERIFGFLRGIVILLIHKGAGIRD